MEAVTGLRILIVDDSAAVSSRLRTLLSPIEGVARVDTATGALEGRRRIRATRPDLVVLDVRLPDGSGLDLLELVRRDALAMTVVMLTNHADPSLRDQCLVAGADFFFDKSTEFERVSDVVAQLVRARVDGRTGLTTVATSKRRTPAPDGRAKGVRSR